MKKSQSGFTLIELVVVIVLLGILSAFALPRFANLADGAYEAAINGAKGSVVSANAIAHVTSMVENIENGDIDMEGVPVTMVAGYPSGDTADNGDICVAAGLDGFSCSSDGGTPAVMTISDVDGECSFTYTEATATSTPVITAPSC